MKIKLTLKDAEGKIEEVLLKEDETFLIYKNCTLLAEEVVDDEGDL